MDAHHTPELNALTATLAEMRREGGPEPTKGDRSAALHIANRMGDRGFSIGPTRLGEDAVRRLALALPDAAKRRIAHALQQRAGAEIVAFPQQPRRPSPPQPPSAA